MEGEGEPGRFLPSTLNLLCLKFYLLGVHISEPSIFGGSLIKVRYFCAVMPLVSPLSK